MLTSIVMPSQTLIDLKCKHNVGKHVRKLHVKFQLNPTVKLEVVIVAKVHISVYVY